MSKFDCPYPTEERCARWDGWRFAKGKQHMDGRRALIYSRVRKNKLNPADTDFSRAEHNQQVLQAVAAKLTSFGTLVKLPFIGDDLLAPVATDLSTHGLHLARLVEVPRRARTERCTAGSAASRAAARSSPTEENRRVISMVTGDSAPQPPPPGLGRVRAGLRDREPDARRSVARFIRTRSLSLAYEPLSAAAFFSGFLSFFSAFSSFLPTVRARVGRVALAFPSRP